MRRLILHTLSLFLLLGLPVSARDFTPLAADRNFVQGSLPDGIRYGIYVNKSWKGAADYAVLDCRSGALRYFAQAPQDSVLLRLITDVRDSVATGRHTLDGQMLLISGDVDRARVADRLGLLSLTVPAGPRDTLPYVLPPFRPDSLSVQVVEDAAVDRHLTAFELTFRAPRPDAALEGTIIPRLIARQGRMAADLTLRRLQCAFEAEALPVAGLSVVHTPACKGPGDETLRVAFFVRREDAPRALTLAASVLGTLDRDGVSQEEARTWAAADNIFLEMDNAALVDNRAVIRRMANHVLYGEDLADTSAAARFFTGRSPSVEQLKAHLDRFLAIRLDPERNVSLRVRTAPAGQARIWAGLLQSGWSLPAPDCAFRIPASDTTGFVHPLQRGERVSNTLKDKVTGGTQWTFANGVRVIYKQMSGQGRFHYAFVFDGGRSAADVRCGASAAWLERAFLLSTVNGRDTEDFLRMLACGGLTMQCRVGYASTRLTGSVSQYRLPLMLQALVAVTTHRRPAPERYAYRRSCDSLALLLANRANRLAALERQLMTEYGSPAHYYPEGLTETVFDELEGFFAERFKRADNGVLVIIGPFPEKKMLNVLKGYMGRFPSGGLLPRALDAPYRESLSDSFTEAPGDRSGWDGMLVAPARSSVEGVVQARLLLYLLRKRLPQDIALSGSIRFAPAERLVLSLSRPGGKKEDIDRVSSVLKDLADGKFSDAEFDAGRQAVLNIYHSRAAHPDWWIFVAKSRVADAKDFNTGWDKKISDLTREQFLDFVQGVSEAPKAYWLVP